MNNNQLLNSTFVEKCQQDFDVINDNIEELKEWIPSTFITSSMIIDNIEYLSDNITKLYNFVNQMPNDLMTYRTLLQMTQSIESQIDAYDSPEFTNEETIHQLDEFIDNIEQSIQSIFRELYYRFFGQKNSRK